MRRIDIAVVLFLVVVQLLTTREPLSQEIVGPKKALLVGKNLVGRLSKKLDPSIPVDSPWGYDSQFFWAMSNDPLIRNPEVTAALDSPSYRYQRVFLPLLVWLTPGHVTDIPYRLFFWGIAGLVLGLFAAYKLAAEWKAPAYVAMAVFITNPGVVFATLHPMADVWAAALTLLGLLFWFKGKARAAGVVFALACLAKETTAFVPGALLLYDVISERKLRLGKTAPLYLCAIVLLLWQGYIRWKLGVWSVEQSSRNFDLPCVATVKVLLSTRALPDKLFAFMISALSLYAIVRIRWPRTPLEALVITQAFLMATAGIAVVEAWRGYARASILFVVLFSCSCLSARRRFGSEPSAPNPTEPLENDV